MEVSKPGPTTGTAFVLGYTLLHEIAKFQGALDPPKAFPRPRTLLVPKTSP